MSNVPSKTSYGDYKSIVGQGKTMVATKTKPAIINPAQLAGIEASLKTNVPFPPFSELTFTISYKNETENPFPWLYLDYTLLEKLATENGLQCELIENGEHYDYLARLY
jgi:hypothetical protein